MPLLGHRFGGVAGVLYRSRAGAVLAPGRGEGLVCEAGGFVFGPDGGVDYLEPVVAFYLPLELFRLRLQVLYAPVDGEVFQQEAADILLFGLARFGEVVEEAPVFNHVEPQQGGMEGHDREGREAQEFQAGVRVEQGHAAHDGQEEEPLHVGVHCCGGIYRA